MRTPKEVVEAFRSARTRLAPVLRELDWDRLSKYDRDIARAAHNPVVDRIDNESVPYMRVATYLRRQFPDGGTVVDVGSFVPTLPLMLAELGFHVVTVEKHELYAGEYAKITSALRETSIEFLDLDIISDPLPGTFDAVLLMAVIEHLNGSPRALLQKCHGLLRDGTSRFVLDVPNAASLWKRLRMLLRGRPPFPAIEHYYDSEYPYAGHNREYTPSDVRKVLEWSGFRVECMDTFNYHLPGILPRLVQACATSDAKQCVLAFCSPI